MTHACQWLHAWITVALWAAEDMANEYERTKHT